ncbi:MAG TPA: class I SAM-dependent methyltransferase [Acidimicrobiales bacterium]|nr:class I SAM-dependent methyltransferase [Acidimicrobiales bacterium]
MSIGGTAAYGSERDLPDLVVRAVALAQRLDFEFSCVPAQGRLLQLLAHGRPGGVIGETGTGCGVGLAWMASAADASTRLVSVEVDPDRAEAASELFAGVPNVTVVVGPWKGIGDYGPFDLLVLDGGGTGKAAEVDPERADPTGLLKSGGTVVIDDFSPCDSWPPRVGGRIDEPRLHWLEHPGLRACEIRLSPTLSTIVATRR